jgi:hypothetical protein
MVGIQTATNPGQSVRAPSFVLVGAGPESIQPSFAQPAMV